MAPKAGLEAGLGQGVGGSEVRASILWAQGTSWTKRPVAGLPEHSIPMPLSARAKGKVRRTGGGASRVIASAPAGTPGADGSSEPAQEGASAGAEAAGRPSAPQGSAGRTVGGKQSPRHQPVNRSQTTVLFGTQ